MATYLDRILDAHRARARADARSLDALVEQARGVAPARGFRGCNLTHPLKEHARIGELTAEIGVDALITVGDAMAAAAHAAQQATPAVPLVLQVPDAASALDVVRALDVRADDVVLVKGSHAVGLELVVAGLLGSVRS